MSDDATAREISRLRDDLRDDLTEIKTALAQLLPREVYQAHHDNLVHRVVALEARIATIETKHAADLKALAEQIEDDEDKRAGRRRWLIGGPILSIVAMIVSIWLALRK